MFKDAGHKLNNRSGDMTMKDKDGMAVPYAYCDVYRFRNDKIVTLSSFVIKTEASGAYDPA